MQEHYYSIKNWAKDDQPREKLLLKGAENLSNSELLAILINNGTRDKSAVDLAKDVLRLGKNNLNELGRLSVKELMRVKGVGMAKAITISAALELGRRRQSLISLKRKTVSASADTAHFLKSILTDYRHEVFAIIFLNQANRILHFEIISEGGITGTVADPRIIIKKALEENAINIILSHNHPSGNISPSKADLELTRKIKEAAALFDIRVLDHIIVGEDGYFSFADEGMI
jgi:DNA repair protein RadC